MPAKAAEEYTASQLHLKKFNPATMRDSCVVVFVAMKGSGKSMCMSDFMFHKRHLPGGFVFSATEESNEFFSQMVPPMYCYSDLDLDKLRDVYDYQEVKMKKYKRTREERDRAKADHGDPGMLDSELEKIDFWAVWERDPHVFGIIEDLMADQKCFKHLVMRELFMNGRHHKMFMMITVQYVMDMPRNLRSNVDYWVLFKEDSQENRENLFKHVASKTKSRAVFNRIMDTCTVNYGCVVVDNRCNTGIIEDAIFWYRAKPRPPFRIGSKRFWRFAEKNYVKPDGRHLDLVQRMKERIGHKRPRGEYEGEEAEGESGSFLSAQVGDEPEATQAYKKLCQQQDVASDFLPENEATHFDVIRRNAHQQGKDFSIVMDANQQKELFGGTAFNNSNNKPN